MADYILSDLQNTVPEPAINDLRTQLVHDGTSRKDSHLNILRCWTTSYEEGECCPICLEKCMHQLPPLHFNNLIYQSIQISMMEQFMTRVLTVLHWSPIMEFPNLLFRRLVDTSLASSAWHAGFPRQVHVLSAVSDSFTPNVTEMTMCVKFGDFIPPSLLFPSLPS